MEIVFKDLIITKWGLKWVFVLHIYIKKIWKLWLQSGVKQPIFMNQTIIRPILFLKIVIIYQFSLKFSQLTLDFENRHR